MVEINGAGKSDWNGRPSANGLSSRLRTRIAGEVYVFERTAYSR